MDRHKRGVFVRCRGAPIIAQKPHACSAQLNARWAHTPFGGL